MLDIHSQTFELQNMSLEVKHKATHTHTHTRTNKPLKATAKLKRRGPLGQICLAKCRQPWFLCKPIETLRLKWPIKQAFLSIGSGAVYHPRCQTPLWPLSGALAALATVWKQTERSWCPTKSVKNKHLLIRRGKLNCTCITRLYLTTSPSNFLFSVSFCFCSSSAACCKT